MRPIDELVLSENDLHDIPLEGGSERLRFYEAGVYRGLLLAGYSEHEAGEMTDRLREAQRDLHE